MIPITTFAGQTVAVFGMARTNIPAAKALLAGGAAVIAWDDGERGRETAADAGIPVADLAKVDWARIAALVLAPGVPLTHPTPHWTVQQAAAAGVPVIGDIELFFRERALVPSAGSRPHNPPRVVAITGTNGKSTTTALVGHVLREAGFDTVIAGNIGTPLLDTGALHQDRVYVLELSSYQLDLTPSVHPDVATVLNITPDHLDRHGTLEHYAAVKARIFANMTAIDTAVLNADDPLVQQHVVPCVPGPATSVAFSVTRRVEHGVSLEDDTLLKNRFPGLDRGEINLVDCPSLRGRHNAENAAAAWAMLHGLLHQRVINDAQEIAQMVQAGFRTFPGLAHRMQIIGHIGATLIVNDSKATNADAAAHALRAFPNIYWLVGGRAKEGGVTALRPDMGSVRHAFLIGEAGPLIEGQLPPEMPRTRSGTIAQAVQDAAAQVVRDGATTAAILLSPACASFDQFPDFEARGRAFEDAAAALPGFMAGVPLPPSTEA